MQNVTHTLELSHGFTLELREHTSHGEKPWAVCRPDGTTLETFDTKADALAVAWCVGNCRTVGDIARKFGWTFYALAEDGADADVCELASASYGRLDELKREELKPADDVRAFVVPSVLAGSDYSGSTVERANFRAFLETFRATDGVVELSGGHGTYAVAIRADIGAPEMLEALEALENYPVVDDDALAELELERDAEAWDSWARDDFKRELARRFGADVDDVDDADILALFQRALSTHSGDGWHDDGAERFVDVDAIARECALADVQALPRVKFEEGAEDARIRAERHDAEEAHTRALELRAWNGGAHRLRDVSPRGAHVARWAERHGQASASVTECEQCGRHGWVNVRPVEGAPDHGGRVFREHCYHGADPASACPDCGSARDGAPGTVGQWTENWGGAFGRVKPGGVCARPTHGHAAQTPAPDSNAGLD